MEELRVLAYGQGKKILPAIEEVAGALHLEVTSIESTHFSAACFCRGNYDPEDALNIDDALAETFADVLGVPREKFLFFVALLAHRARSLSHLKRTAAGERIAAKLGEKVPDWAVANTANLHRYASSLGGKSCHAMVKLAREQGGQAFEEEARPRRTRSAAAAATRPP